jgi:hypothetical protein
LDGSAELSERERKKTARAASWSTEYKKQNEFVSQKQSSQKATNKQKTTAAASNKHPKTPMSTTSHRKPSSSTATTTMLLVVMALVGWSAPSPVAAQTQTYTDGALFRQQFEKATAATDYSFGGKATVTNGILKASYIPDDRGSPRLTKHSKAQQKCRRGRF